MENEVTENAVTQNVVTEQAAPVIAEDASFVDSFATATGQTPQEQVVVNDDKGGVKKVDASSTVVKSDDQVVKDKVPGQEDYKTLYEKELQRNKSWEGRLSASDRQKNELLNRVKELEKGTVKPKVENTNESLVDTDDPLIKSFISEMGDDFIKPLDAYIKKTLDAALKPFTEKLPLIEQSVSTFNATRTQDHYGQILEKHADVQELLEQGTLENYIESLPYKDALDKKRIMKSGTTKEVISFLDEFKEKTKTKVETDVKNNETVHKVNQTEVDNATVVKTNSSFLPRGKAGKDDFVGAFKEAVSA